MTNKFWVNQNTNKWMLGRPRATWPSHCESTHSTCTNFCIMSLFVHDIIFYSIKAALSVFSGMRPEKESRNLQLKTHWCHVCGRLNLLLVTVSFSMAGGISNNSASGGVCRRCEGKHHFHSDHSRNQRHGDLCTERKIVVQRPHVGTTQLPSQYGRQATVQWQLAGPQVNLYLS